MTYKFFNFKLSIFSFRIIIFIFGLFIILIPSAKASMVDSLKGHILLEVEDKGKAWYFHPETLKRYYLGRPADAFSIMRDVGIGISNADIQKIPVADMNLNGYDSDFDGLSDTLEITFGTDKNNQDSDNDGHKDKNEIINGYDPAVKDSPVIIDEEFACKLSGKIFLQTESFGEAWYVNPDNCKRYYLGRPADAFLIMKNLSKGISSANFNLLKTQTASAIDPLDSILKPSSNNGIKKYIAHALGNYGEFSGTNTLTAMEYNYNQGYRVFEVDLSMTFDNQVVAYHVGQEDKYGLATGSFAQVSHSEYKQLLYRNSLATSDMEDLLKFLKNHPDVYLILDPKDDFTSVMQNLVINYSDEYRDVFDRLIPQIYEPSHLNTLDTLYDFPDVIFTLYRISFDYSEMVSFMRNADITAVTMNYNNYYNKDFSELIQSMDLGVFVHTVNDKDLIENLHKDNVGVYTDNGLSK